MSERQDGVRFARLVPAAAVVEAAPAVVEAPAAVVEVPSALVPEVPIELDVAGVNIRVRRGFDRGTLAEVLEVIAAHGTRPGGRS